MASTSPARPQSQDGSTPEPEPPAAPSPLIKHGSGGQVRARPSVCRLHPVPQCPSYRLSAHGRQSRPASGRRGCCASKQMKQRWVGGKKQRWVGGKQALQLTCVSRCTCWAQMGSPGRCQQPCWRQGPRRCSSTPQTRSWEQRACRRPPGCGPSCRLAGHEHSPCAGPPTHERSTASSSLCSSSPVMSGLAMPVWAHRSWTTEFPMVPGYLSHSAHGRSIASCAAPRLALPDSRLQGIRGPAHL